MNSAPDEREKPLIEVFNEAKALPPGEQREHFLDEACGKDEQFRAELHSLLSAGNSAGDYLHGGPAVSPQLKAEFARLKPEEAGERIGHYKLLQEIGQGGFGTVWMADQEQPVKRRVALKIIRMGMDTREVIARFEQERQALAMMDHPNIARVFDAGATPVGRPFFVMELVKGVPITEFCDEHQLDTQRRLELFGDVCSAINHAHQKGVIHRDIKPSNVMITLHGDKPVVKVIDFGIAKATLGKLTEKTLFTRFEQFVGTPVYMSPEQAVTSGLDIDTRSDIYALGILLYELLTGKPPFDAKSLASAGYDEMRRIIREVEPPKPSSQLSTIVGEERTRLAKARHVDPDKLRHLVEPDLDWIVMKAIEKDRARRYETANGLALDIHRFLTDQPVEARPPSRWYVLQKTFKRHKVGVAAAAAVILALAFGLGISTWTLIKEKRALGRAVTAEKKAQDNATQAERNAADAKEQRKQAEALAENNRLNLYAARIKLAAQAIAEGDVRHAQELLEGLRPQPGQEDLRSFDWYYLHQLASNEKSALTQVGGRVRSVAYSPDGRLLASASDDGIVRLWDAKTQALRAQLNGHTGVVAAVAFAPDSATLASAGADGTLRIWKVSDAAPLHTAHLGTGTNGLTVLAFSPDGSRLAVGEGNVANFGGNPLTRYAECSKSGRILLWDTKTRMIERVLDAKGHDALSLAFSPDGSQLAGGGVHNTLTLFDVATGQELRMISNLTGPVFATLFLPTQKVVAASWDPYQDSGRITIFDATTLGQNQVMLTAGKVTCLALSPDGRTLATAGPDRVLRMRDLATGLETGVFHGHKWEIWSVAFSPDGESVATGGFDDAIRIWDTKNDPARQRIAGSRPFSVAFSPDGSLLACGSGSVVDIRDASTGTVLRSLSDYKVTGDMRATFSPDGTILAATGTNQEVHFWDTRSWRHWTPRKEDMAPAPDTKVALFAADSQFAFSPDSATLARSSWDGFIRIWDSRSGALMDTVELTTGSLGYTRDGTQLISAHRTALQIWNTHTKEIESRGPGAGRLLRISGNGRWLAYGDSDEIRLCELPSLTQVRAWRTHREVMYGINFSHDGKILATASWDGTVKLWQVATGQELFTIPSHSGVVWSVAFSPDDRTLAFAASGEIHILRCVSSEKVAKLRQESLSKSYEALGRSGKWKEALAALGELMDLQPANHRLYVNHSALLVAIGDTQGYLKASQKIQNQFREDNDPQVGERMAKACLLLPSSGMDADILAGWLEAALSATGDGVTSPWNQCVKALADYRQGNFASAAEWAEKATADTTKSTALNAQAWMILAMARWQLKQPDDAHSALARGSDAIEYKLPKIDEGDLGWDWPHWIAAHEFHREARQLIEGDLAGREHRIPMHKEDWRTALRNAGIKYTAKYHLDGTWTVKVESKEFRDCSLFEGAPIRELNLHGTSVTDLRPLGELSLTKLDIRETPVRDLTALRASKLSGNLQVVALWKTQVTDFSPLAACTKLEVLDASATSLTDLSVVRGRKLRVIQLIDTKVSDLSPLAGMPLTFVTLAGSAVTDVSPLLQCSTLERLVLPDRAKDVTALRALPALKELSYRYGSAGAPSQTAAEFWKEYDAK